MADIIKFEERIKEKNTCVAACPQCKNQAFYILVQGSEGKEATVDDLIGFECVNEKCKHAVWVEVDEE